MKWMQLIVVTILLGGCAGKQPAKTESTSEKPATTGEEIPADPYAAMEAERNAVKESIGGKATETPSTQENPEQKAYSGVVKINGRGSAEQTIILDSNRGSFVLLGDKSTELLACEGKFVTVLGRLTKDNPVTAEFNDLEQVKVEGIVRLANNK